MSDFVFTSNSNLASKYKTVLPSVEVLKQLIENKY
ncbi:hypothetical protein C8C83_5646 [Flavobacterium sp. 90]|nr:hypothetical protein C8C82_0277 [Flavobacterium sp. 81]TCK57595.1 hypothetical protein C8C83_5646 [Flavobacterium sp. 90]